MRQTIYADLAGELRDQLHERAALLLAERGEYTLAAAHWQRGNQPALAVRVWYQHRSQELRRGQADSARRIFGQVSAQRLRAREQKLLRLLRAELDLLLGESRRGLHEIDAASWDADELSHVRALKLRGDFNANLGNYAEAQADFEHGFAMTARLLNEQINLLERRSHVQLLQRDLADAWRLAQMGRYSAELLQGMVQEQRGNYVQAEAHFQQALTAATAQQAMREMAEANRRLLKIYGRRQQLAQALPHAEAAIAGFETIGDLKKAALVHANLAATFLDAGDYAATMRYGKAAFDFFEQTDNPLVLAAVATNLAEAAFELGDVAEARRLAQLALRLEEPSSQPYALYTLALVAQHEGDSVQAESLLASCRDLAAQAGDNYVAASAWLKSAEIHQSHQHQAQQQKAAQQALALFQQLDIADMVDRAAVLTTIADVTE